MKQDDAGYWNWSHWDPDMKQYSFQFMLQCLSPGGEKYLFYCGYTEQKLHPQVENETIAYGYTS
jgi:hypothetical protein